MTMLEGGNNSFLVFLKYSGSSLSSKDLRHRYSSSKSAKTYKAMLSEKTQWALKARGYDASSFSSTGRGAERSNSERIASSAKTPRLPPAERRRATLDPELLHEAATAVKASVGGNSGSSGIRGGHGSHSSSSSRREQTSSKNQVLALHIESSNREGDPRESHSRRHMILAATQQHRRTTSSGSDTMSKRSELRRVSESSDTAIMESRSFSDRAAAMIGNVTSRVGNGSSETSGNSSGRKEREDLRRSASQRTMLRKSGSLRNSLTIEQLQQLEQEADPSHNRSSDRVFLGRSSMKMSEQGNDSNDSLDRQLQKSFHKQHHHGSGTSPLDVSTLERRLMGPPGA